MNEEGNLCAGIAAPIYRAEGIKMRNDPDRDHCPFSRDARARRVTSADGVGPSKQLGANDVRGLF